MYVYSLHPKGGRKKKLLFTDMSVNGFTDISEKVGVFLWGKVRVGHETKFFRAFCVFKKKT